jgi:hypothetical protein
MKIKFNNLGAIKEAEIDLCKKLSIFCGPNGTGKTYVGYAIYGYLKVLYIGNALFKLQDLLDKSYITFDLNYQELYSLKKRYIDFINDGISSEFASPADFFKDFNADLGCSAIEFENSLRNFEINFDYEYSGIAINFTKQKDSDSAVVKLNKPPALNADLIKAELFILATLSKYLCNFSILNSYFLPVERNSVYTFSKELSLKRLRKNDDNQNVEDASELQERMTRYPHAIRDALMVAEDLTNIKKRVTEFEFLADNIENQVLNGKILISEQGEVQFVSNHSKDQTLPVHLTASLIKTLSGLIIYLKHQASINDLIIIDEPEINLHPDNQILLARIFARLINHGFRLIISTHSDYIIRELNNLIMLSSERLEIKKIAEKYHYQTDEKIQPNDINAYLFNFNSDSENKIIVQKLEISENGFEISTIDDAIHNLNDISEDLFYALNYSDNE